MKITYDNYFFFNDFDISELKDIFLVFLIENLLLISLEMKYI